MGDALSDETSQASEELLAAAQALAQSGREVEAMVGVLAEARAELRRARTQLHQASAPSGLLRSVVSALLGELVRPALLVDHDLWVVGCNDAAARLVGSSASEAVGKALARWPDATALGRQARAASGAPVGPVDTDGSAVVVSLGPMADGADPGDAGLVLVLLGP